MDKRLKMTYFAPSNFKQKMMKRIGLMLLTTGFLLFQGCRKEYSFESSSNPSEGSLQSDVTGDCLPKIVAGTYEAGVPLSGDAHFLQVEINVTLAGNYIISTDTVNGFYYRATGSFATPGLVTVKLQGYGTPANDGISNFTVTYLASACTVPVTVLPAGGATPAVFTFDGSPDACMDAEVSGEYVKDVATNSSHFTTIYVNVITPGTYSVSTVISNGISFSGSGVLSSTGPQTITLYASGTPLSATGTTNIPVSASGSTCSFPINVLEEASANFAWTLTSGGTTYSGTTLEAYSDNSSGMDFLVIDGEDTNGDNVITIALANATGAIGTGTYSGISATGRFNLFFFTSDGVSAWTGMPGTGSNLPVVVTEYNTTNKMIAGTFSGKVLDDDNNEITITAGSFRAKLP